MKKKHYSFFVVTVLMLIACGWFLKPERNNTNMTDFSFGMTEGGEENPRARQDYEIMRKMDPVSQEIPVGIAQQELDYVLSLPIAENAGNKRSTEWQQRGPFNIGGRTRAMAIDITNPNIILAGGVSGGMWRSEDAGKSWKRTTAANQLASATSVVQDTRPGKTSIWYYSTGEFYGNSASYPGDGVFKSSNGGKTWAALTATNQPQIQNQVNNSWRLTIDHTRLDSDILYMASWGAILRSNDGGLTWKNTLGGSITSVQNAGAEIITTPKGIKYATLSSVTNKKKGVFRSEDGLHWVDITPPFTGKTWGRLVLDYFKGDENVIYLFGLTPGMGKLGKQTRDNGDVTENNSLWRYEYGPADSTGFFGKWQDRSANLPVYFQTDGYAWGDLFSQGGYDLCIRIHPTNEDMVVIGGTNVYRSTDGFKTDQKTTWIGGYGLIKDKIEAFFNGLTYPNHHPDQHELIFNPNDPKGLYSANDGGIFYTDDCWAEKVTWNSLNNGFINSQFYATSINQNPGNNALSNHVLAGFQDNETQMIDLNQNPNDPWKRLSCCDGSYNAIFDEGDTTWMISSKQLGGMFLFKHDKVGNLLGATRFDPTGAFNYLFINPFITDKRHPERVYVAGGAFIWRNSDITQMPLVVENKTQSKNWKRLLNTQAGTGSISALDITDDENPVLYYGTTAGKLFKVEDIIQDENSRVAELTKTGNPLGGSGYISSVAIDPVHQESIMVTFSNYSRKSIYFSSDAGVTWNNVSGNLEENSDGSGAGPSCQVVKILYKKPWQPVYLVGTSTGLYSTSSLNGDQTIWHRESQEQIGVCEVRDIDFRPSDGLVFVSTHGCGSFSANLSGLSSVQEMNANSSISLFPNPVRDQLTINHSLKDKYLNVKVYDLSGKILMEKKYTNDAGLQVIQWNVQSLKPGVYVLNVEGNNGTYSNNRFIKE